MRTPRSSINTSMKRWAFQRTECTSVLWTSTPLRWRSTDRLSLNEGRDAVNHPSSSFTHPASHFRCWPFGFFTHPASHFRCWFRNYPLKFTSVKMLLLCFK
ncbi:unnamed protein product [Toxocara canis]|uniref:Secreted protein n=1 Tax=Toxocara canis TaxID=6265 RepID=A0A183U4P9_TOXCA|nr:unnamed protein product [Toxocara canis]